MHRNNFWTAKETHTIPCRIFDSQFRYSARVARDGRELTSVGPKHCAAQRIAMMIIGAVVRLRGKDRFRARKGMGISTGRITKMIETTKSTNVAMADPDTIRCNLH